MEVYLRPVDFRTASHHASPFPEPNPGHAMRVVVKRSLAPCAANRFYRLCYISSECVKSYINVVRWFGAESSACRPRPRARGGDFRCHEKVINQVQKSKLLVNEARGNYSARGFMGNGDYFDNLLSGYDWVVNRARLCCGTDVDCWWINPT